MQLQRPTSRLPIRIAILASILAGLAQPAAAEPGRKPSRKSQPVPTARAAPDVTATIPAPAPSAAEEPLHPFNLPAAPRSRMRHCGLKWQEVKMSGNAGDKTWREFATKCLTEAESAETKVQP